MAAKLQAAMEMAYPIFVPYLSISHPKISKLIP